MFIKILEGNWLSL